MTSSFFELYDDDQGATLLDLPIGNGCCCCCLP